MTKKNNLILLYLLILIEILILCNSKIIVNNTIISLKMFIKVVFPSLFPTMIVGNLLVKNNLELIIPKFIKKLFNKLFNYNNSMTSIYIISMLTGTPSNAIYINEYLDKKLISEKEAESLLLSTHFINPLFVISTVGIYVFNDIKIGFILLFILWISNFIKAYITRPKKHKNEVLKDNINNERFISTLFNTIKTTLNALLMILGIIILCNILITLIKCIFNLNNNILIILNGILEMTSGITKLINLNINNIIKVIIAYLMLNFGGISIQMQVFSMLENKKISYLKYLIFRLL